MANYHDPKTKKTVKASCKKEALTKMKPKPVTKPKSEKTKEEKSKDK